MKRFVSIVALFMGCCLHSLVASAQILTLTGTGESLTFNIAGAPTTTNPVYSVVYRSSDGVFNPVGALNGATVVTPIAGVAAVGTDTRTRFVESLRVRNADSVAQVVTINKVAATVSYPLSVVTLQPGEAIHWNADGFRSLDVNGQLKQALAQGALTSTQSIGASTIALGTNSATAAVLPAGTAGTYPTTAADGTVGVRVDVADQVTGRLLLIGNGVAAQILKVYPPTGGTINGAAANAAFSSASGKGVVIQCLSASGNTWLAW